MKRYIYSAISDRAAEYAKRHSKEAKQSAKAIKQRQWDYVKSIRSTITESLELMIKEQLFSNSANSELFDTYFDNYMEYRHEYIVKFNENPEIIRQNYGANCYMGAQDDCMRISVSVFGPYGSNHGLEWLADLQTGGDGNLCCIYVSKMPARMKRQMNVYKDQIAQFIQDLELEVLACKNDSNGFYFDVINDEYEAITNGETI